MGNVAGNVSPRDFGEVVILMGGDSPEREISLVSGNCTLEALLERGVRAVAIDVDRNIVDQLLARKPDRAFIALHGASGENGVIQGLLEILQIPYASSDLASSALTMDKERSNIFWRSLSIPVIPHKTLKKNDSITKIVSHFKFPLCVKPASSGSSYGISKVDLIEQLFPAYAEAKKYSDEVLVEPWIDGREFSVGILGEQALPVIEIVTQNGFYDYDAKYINNSTDYICPCSLSVDRQKEMKELALKAFLSAGCRYWGRADFIIDNDEKVWLLEVNTIPGLTTHSLVPKAAAQIGINFADLIWKILEFTL